MDINRENELLLCVARSEMDAKTRERFRQLLSQEINWSMLLKNAERHRLAPLLYWHLKEFSDECPKDAFDNLKQSFNKNARDNLLLTAETIRLVRLFEEHCIIAIPYKGVALAQQLYGNTGLRSSVDLDLLICRKDVQRAREVLLNAGYEQEIEISDEQLNVYARSECDQVFIHRQTQIYLELHWAVTPPYFGFELGTEDLIEKLENVELNNSSVPALRSEDLLLVLCVNATKEMWERLEWIAGVAELIRKSRHLNWDETVEQAKKLKSLRMLLLGVYLVSELFKVDLPQSVSSLIEQDRAVEPLVQQVYERLFDEREGNLSFTKLTLFRLKAREKKMTRASYCLLRLATPTHADLSLVKFPRALSWLYYFIRPARLLIQFVSAKFQSKFLQGHTEASHEAAE
jgi:hypothetical protein